MTPHNVMKRLARRSSAHTPRVSDAAAVPPTAVADLVAAHAAAGPAALAAAAADLRKELAGASVAFAALISLQSRLDATYPCTAAEAASERHLNRYSDVLPYDHTRVRLEALESESEPESSGNAAENEDDASVPRCSDYINASLIECSDPVTGASWSYIAAQGPLPYTAAAFWRMVAQQRCPAVTMLTALVEGRRRKCHPYFADAAGGVMEVGDGLVVRTLECEDAGLGLVRRRIKVEALPGTAAAAAEEGLPWTCEHYQFTSWPDHGVPRSPAPILALSALLRGSSGSSGGTTDDNGSAAGGSGGAAGGPTPDNTAASKDGPVVVHCSAGIGRSGVFCVLDSAARRLVGAAAAPDAAAAIAAARKAVDVPGSVEALRHARAGMVQTVDQFAFCHAALLALIEATTAAIREAQPPSPTPPSPPPPAPL